MKRLKKKLEFTPDHGQHRNDPNGLLTPEMIRMIYELCLLKLNDEQICNVIGVHPTTFAKWKRNNDELSTIIQHGKEIADAEVAKTLLQRALGYEYEEEHYVEGVDAQGKEYHHTKKVTKHVVGDTTAMIFWLKNRQRDKWADVHQMESNTNVNVNVRKIDLETLDPKEKELVRGITLKQLTDPNAIQHDS